MTFTISRTLLPIKAHFFLFFGGISPVFLFLATFAKQLGFSAVLVGAIFSVLPIMSTLGKLLMGAFADRFKCHKSLIIVYLIVAIISFSSLTFIRPIDKRVESVLICSNKPTITLCSEGNIENCSESKIKLEYNQENLTVGCEMECYVDDQFIELACSSWNSSYNCNTQMNKVQKRQLIKIEETDSKIYNNYQLGNKTRNSSTVVMFPANTSLSVLQFAIDLLPHHVKQEGRCLSFEIGGVSDDAAHKKDLNMPRCETKREFHCQMVCENPVLTDIGKVVDEEISVGHSQFWIFILITSICWIGLGTITCLGETICFGLLDGHPSEFGKQRLWGSLGWGAMSFLGGTLIDTFSGNKAKKDYRPIFYLCATLLSMNVFAASKIKDTKRVKSTTIMWDIGKLFADVRVVIYLIWCIIMGMLNGFIVNFLFWHLEDLTGCDGMERIKTLEGLYVSLQTACGELPFFFLNAWILSKIGHINAMSFTLFTFGIIFLLFSMLDNPVHFLPISVLNGITFSTMYATMTSYASIIAPPGTEATMQGLVGSVHEGLGISFGSFLAGLLMHYWNGTKVFFLYGIAALTLGVLHIFIQLLLQKSQNDSTVTIDKDPRKSVQYNTPENAVQILNDGENDIRK